jgi:pyruvate kinase
MKKTKIVATMGPASSDKETLRKMLNEGLNVCRLNFSHGSHDVHQKTIETIRELNEETGFHIAILADLQGPKIRTGKMTDNGVELVPENEVTIVTDEILGTAETFTINHTGLPTDVQPGEKI